MVVGWLLVTVTVFAEVFPTTTLPKLRLAGLNVSGVTPVPVRVTNCGLVTALSVKVSAPAIAPATRGLKVTLMVQLLLAAREPEQLSVSEKSPLAAIEPMPRALVPELVSVMG